MNTKITHTPQWEYKSTMGLSDKDLNEYGKDGWELVCVRVWNTHQSGTEYIMKRPYHNILDSTLLQSTEQVNSNTKEYYLNKFISSLFDHNPYRLKLLPIIHHALHDQGLQYNNGKLVPVDAHSTYKEDEEEPMSKTEIEDEKTAVENYLLTDLDTAASIIVDNAIQRNEALIDYGMSHENLKNLVKAGANWLANRIKIYC